MRKRIVLIFLYTFCISMFSFGIDAWIRINQLGYLPNTQKKAILLSEPLLNIILFSSHNALTNQESGSFPAVVSFDGYETYKSNYITDFISFKQQEGIPDKTAGHNQYTCGGITRTDSNKKQISLIFSGHEFADGYKIVRKTLKKLNIKAAFFFTGDFYRNRKNKSIIKGLQQDHHYLGGHSDKHILYCSWQKRDSLLVDKNTFLTDIKANYTEMEKLGIPKNQAPFFLPPYEWYNDSISQWCKEIGLQLVNFTPGTLSNADYTIPEMRDKYYSSNEIYARIMEVESKQGLNGNIMLFHLGTDKRRQDKFYPLLYHLLLELSKAGYDFVDLYQATGMADKNVIVADKKQKRKN